MTDKLRMENIKLEFEMYRELSESDEKWLIQFVEKMQEKIERYEQAFKEIKNDLPSYEFWKLTHIFKRLEE